ncbi:hypothetical protein QVD17_28730 [Tagetes erecta]|uniref:Uncharacterized protein n=1 Tax=Tagetes erecta TaxID=13708 RepID=A0AAD8KB50_TARER|nr:hypothetical protein QVD17_28730 [Tagetes erecta]
MFKLRQSFHLHKHASSNRLRDGSLEFSHRAVHFRACFGFWLLAVVFVHGRWLLVGVAFGNAIRKGA